MAIENCGIFKNGMLSNKKKKNFNHKNNMDQFHRQLSVKKGRHQKIHAYDFTYVNFRVQQT